MTQAKLLQLKERFLQRIADDTSKNDINAVQVLYFWGAYGIHGAISINALIPKAYKTN